MAGLSRQRKASGAKVDEGRFAVDAPHHAYVGLRRAVHKAVASLAARRREKERSVRILPEDTAIRLFFAAAHDIGKATPVFRQKRAISRGDLDERIEENRFGGLPYGLTAILRIHPKPRTLWRHRYCWSMPGACGAWQSYWARTTENPRAAKLF